MCDLCQWISSIGNPKLRLENRDRQRVVEKMEQWRLLQCAICGLRPFRSPLTCYPLVAHFLFDFIADITAADRAGDRGQRTASAAANLVTDKAA
jgi:hypothetical protein